MMQSLALQFIIHLLINGKFGIIKKQTENIRKALDQFLWVTHFTNIDVTEKVNLFNKTMKNTLNYILHETITCNVRDSPWINKDIKELIHEFLKFSKLVSHIVKIKTTSSLFISSNFFNQS